MTRRHKGNFSAKHGSTVTIEAEIIDAVKTRLSDGTIPCQSAFEVAIEKSVAPSLVGASIDLQEIRITKCQLGLFGYGSGASPLRDAEKVDDALEAAIHHVLENGRLSCQNAWKIAKDLGRTRMAVSRACEWLGIRINRCQLGAF